VVTTIASRLDGCSCGRSRWCVSLIPGFLLWNSFGALFCAHEYSLGSIDYPLTHHGLFTGSSTSAITMNCPSTSTGTSREGGESTGVQDVREETGRVSIRVVLSHQSSPRTRSPYRVSMGIAPSRPPCLARTALALRTYPRTTVRVPLPRPRPRPRPSAAGGVKPSLPPPASTDFATDTGFPSRSRTWTQIGRLQTRRT
jgi:hypothetical protein